MARRVELSVLRQCRIAEHCGKDHGGELAMVRKTSFSLEPTIFKNVGSPLARAVLTAKLSREPFWHESASQRIASCFASVPRAPDYDQCILDFMNDDCDFAMEHADGSFMDHLQFCYEYSVAHFKGHSPRVLLLHSVLGVGTNYFPCDASKIPQLESLLTADEFLHIEAFPSFLRLIIHGGFLPALEALDASTVKSVDIHRVIDNKRITVKADDLWTALNYQLIHLLDFLPALDWKTEIDRDVFLSNFAALYKLLTSKKKLEANVDLDVSQTARSPDSAYAPDPKALTLGQLIRDYVPAAIQVAIGKKEIAKYSRAINHDLTFHITAA